MVEFHLQRVELLRWVVLSGIVLVQAVPVAAQFERAIVHVGNAAEELLPVGAERRGERMVVHRRSSGDSSRSGVSDEEFSTCEPTTTPLVLPSGYEVSLCYEKPDGTVGEGRGGLWMSREAGLLWFFDRDNVEVLVKVLDGCAINNHHWVFTAPVTDLGFNLHVTDSEGRRWTHRNPRGVAKARIDTSAFVCGASVSAAAEDVDHYQYDDGDNEGGFGANAWYAVQLAQRFRLRGDGRLRYIEACFLRVEADPHPLFRWRFDVHADDDGFPGESLLDPLDPWWKETSLPKEDPDLANPGAAPGFCDRYTDREVQLPGGDVWVSVYYYGNKGLEEQNLPGGDSPPGTQKGVQVDFHGVGETVIAGRGWQESSEEVADWEILGPPSDVMALAVRIGVDHTADGDDPDDGDGDDPDDGDGDGDDPDDGDGDGDDPDDGDGEEPDDGIKVEPGPPEHYQHDDDTFEDGYSASSAYAVQVAQRFQTTQAGEIAYLEACWQKSETDTGVSLGHIVQFELHADDNGRPGESLLGRPIPQAVLLSADHPTVTCRSTTEDDFREYLQNLAPLDEGEPIWVSVIWYGEEGLLSAERPKLLAVDTNGPADAAVMSRELDGFLNPVDGWGRFEAPGTRAVGIRMGLDGGPPQKGEYTECFPTSESLVFDGGYKVSMCYETTTGELGSARAGLFATAESGLLWFFNPDNAEVLVKVLNGCAYNGHRWIFLAPVTDVAFNLYVTDSEGRSWTHRNRQGENATKADTSAFRCN